MADTEVLTPPNKIKGLGSLRTPNPNTENKGTFSGLSSPGRDSPAALAGANGAAKAADGHVSLRQDNEVGPTRQAWNDATRAAALEYAEHGVPVFPCGFDKRPLVKGGFKVASLDAEEVAAWWHRFPQAMIGVPTGAASGFLVLDLDRKDGVDGFAAVPGWRQMTDVMVRTPSGGAHLYFAFDKVRPMRNSAGKFAPGVDIRGEGGYVIVPPSRPDMARPEYRIEDGCDDLVRSGAFHG